MAQAVIIHRLATDESPDCTDYRGKFIQLNPGRTHYRVFASAPLHRFHNRIVAHFAADRNIAHRWVNNQRLEIQAPEFTVVGGEKFRADSVGKTPELRDSSQAYGRFDARDLAQAIAEAGHPWSCFHVRIA
ncbi:MAG: hypothetical protein ACYDBW_06145 [Sulfuricaulis sp.]